MTREQTDFASQRDELCRDYAAEARHGFCAARMTEARAALLRKRAEELQHKGADFELKRALKPTETESAKVLSAQERLDS